MQMRLQRNGSDNLTNMFTHNVKITRANIIGPWKWWNNYTGASHGEFVQIIARTVLSLRCNDSDAYQLYVQAHHWC
jgi:hypothetical protein